MLGPQIVTQCRPLRVQCVTCNTEHGLLQLLVSAQLSYRELSDAVLGKVLQEDNFQVALGMVAGIERGEVEWSVLLCRLTSLRLCI